VILPHPLHALQVSPLMSALLAALRARGRVSPLPTIADHALKLAHAGRLPPAMAGGAREDGDQVGAGSKSIQAGPMRGGAHAGRSSLCLCMVQ